MLALDRPRTAALLWMLALDANAAAQAASGSGAPDDTVRRDAIVATVPRLGRLLVDGIERTRPSANFFTRAGRATVFDGSYDWHSCISAHWAALCIARVCGDASLASKVLDRLTPEALERERALFGEVDTEATTPTSDNAEAAKPKARTGGVRAFFMPFADSWLLILLAEIARHEGRDTEALRGFRAETEDRVLRALESGTFPEGPSNPETGELHFDGSYRSLLFACVALRIAGTVSPGSGDRLTAFESDRLEPHREALAHSEIHQPNDFLDVRALFALLDRLRAQGSPTPAYPIPESFEALPESVTIRNCHALGRLLSATWPLAEDGRRDEAAATAFERRTAEFLARTDLWDGDFGATAHWVPQYLWMGLWIARGRD